MDEQRFTIHQTHDDDALEEIRHLLEQERDVTSIISESGQHYSVPDGDDLPEWYALRIYCETEDLERFMTKVSRNIERALGKEMLEKVTIGHF